MTHFFNAISSMFPEGERFFIRSVRHYADEIADPVLRAQVQAFVRQEAQHFKQHDTHCEMLNDQGYTFLARMNQFASNGLKWTSERFPRFALASTVGTEHITAVLADRLLSAPEQWLGPMSDEMRPLWRWHAVEEGEHKAVAFDVYRECVERKGRRWLWLRRVTMAYVLVVFFLETFVRHCYLLVKDGKLRPRLLWRGFRTLWGSGGLLRSLSSQMGAFFRADFHPWQHDNSALLERSIIQLGKDAFAST